MLPNLWATTCLTIYWWIPVWKSSGFRSRPRPQKWRVNPGNTGLLFNMVATGLPTKTAPSISSDWSSFLYTLYIVPKSSMNGRIKAYVYPENAESAGLLERYRENWDLL